MKPIIVLAVMFAVALALSGISAAQTQVSYTDDLDGDGIPDDRDDDRDGDGVPNDRDAYPDDYTRSTMEDDARPDITEETTDDGGATGLGVDCCGLDTPWFWIIVGSGTILFGYFGKQFHQYKFLMYAAGIIMIIYGFSLWQIV